MRLLETSPSCVIEPLFTRPYPMDFTFRKAEVLSILITDRNIVQLDMNCRQVRTLTTVSYSLQDVSLPEKVDVVVSEWMVCNYYSSD